MFLGGFIKEDFYKTYMQLFNIRFTYCSLAIENIEDSIAEPARAIEVYNNMQAFNYLFDNCRNKKLYPHDIQKIAEIVNQDIKYLSSGYRKVAVAINNKAFFEPVETKRIPEQMMILFDNYYNVWTDLDPYEREARFHISMVRIQPFEDGNKRTGRIIMNYHLCKQDKAPVIICEDDRDEYFNYISKGDFDGFAKMIKRLSKEEFEVMLGLYQRVNNTNEENTSFQKQLKKA